MFNKKLKERIESLEITIERMQKDKDNKPMGEIFGKFYRNFQHHPGGYCHWERDYHPFTTCKISLGWVNIYPGEIIDEVNEHIKIIGLGWIEKDRFLRYSSLPDKYEKYRAEKEKIILKKDKERLGK